MNLKALAYQLRRDTIDIICAKQLVKPLPGFLFCNLDFLHVL